MCHILTVTNRHTHILLDIEEEKSKWKKITNGDLTRDNLSISLSLCCYFQLNGRMIESTRNLHPFDSAKSAGRSNEHSTVEYVSQTVIDDASHRRKLLLSHAWKRKWRHQFSFWAKWYSMIVASRAAIVNIQMGLWKSATIESCWNSGKHTHTVLTQVVSFWSQITIKWNSNDESNELKSIATYKNENCHEKMRTKTKYIILK